MTSGMLVRNKRPSVRHDSDLLVFRFVDHAALELFGTLHPGALTHANVRHFHADFALEVSTRSVQLFSDERSVTIPLEKAKT